MVDRSSSHSSNPSNDHQIAAKCQRCGHIRTAHKSVLPPKGACYMPGCVCNEFKAAA